MTDETVKKDDSVAGSPTATKRPRGRPKAPWDPFDDELFRRLKSGEAEETVEAEARYLHEWAKKQRLVATGEKAAAPISAARIRNRINKRYNKAEGYKLVRENLRSELARAAREADPSQI